MLDCFSHVFDEVQKNSIQIWKYGLYFLTVEYDNKPALAPPFIIFEHIYLSCKWIWKRTCRSEKYNGKKDNGQAKMKKKCSHTYLEPPTKLWLLLFKRNTQ